MNKTLTPVIYRGKELPDYFLDKDGNIYSTKRTFLHKLVVSNHNDKYNPYPKIVLCLDGKGKTLQLHRLVCETFHKKPTPDILTEEQWSSMREDVRKIVLEYIEHADRWQVNHIDHNPKNYHPSNLEWVTISENQQKYQEHKKLNN
jgi:hypothetical protein